MRNRTRLNGARPEPTTMRLDAPRRAQPTFSPLSGTAAPTVRIPFPCGICMDRGQGGQVCGDMVDGLGSGIVAPQVDLHKSLVGKENLQEAVLFRGPKGNRMATQWLAHAVCPAAIGDCPIVINLAHDIV